MAWFKHFILGSLISLCGFSVQAEQPIVFGGETLPPFVYIEDNQVVGPAPDIIREICRRLDKQCLLDIYPVKRLMSMMENNELDGVITLGRNSARENDFYFSLPYARTEYGFFMLADQKLDLDDMRQLAGYQIVTLYGSNMLATLEQLRGKYEVDFEILSETTLEQAFQKLYKGRYRSDKVAIFANLDIGRHIIRTYEAIDKISYVMTQNRLHYFIGFPKNANDPAFVQDFNKALEALYHEGRLSEILKTYFLSPPERAAYIN